jgi:enolase-phosphatase E1
VTLPLAERRLAAVLLDIEGTTTPIAFVHDVLFPFARTHLADWLEARSSSAEFNAIVEQLARESAADRARATSVPAWDTSTLTATRASIARYAVALMDEDRKSPGLKLLQGLIWESGYQAGELRGQVFVDVLPALHRWRAAGLRLAIYSSGSELAQRRLFESTPDGDLTPLFDGFYDTGMGGKKESASYLRIVERLRVAAERTVFISDVTAELEAAKGAGLQVILSLRDGNAVQPHAEEYERVLSFDRL